MNFHGVDSQFRLMGPLAFGLTSRFLFSGLFFLGIFFLGLAVGESLVEVRSVFWI